MFANESTEKASLIVVIEDNPGDVELLRAALDEEGEPYELKVLHDGLEAIEFFQQRSMGDRRPCVIVLDLHLPKHNGSEVLRVIRSDSRLDHVSVVALTTLASPREEDEVRNIGVRLYLRKPVSLDEFMLIGKEILALCKEPSLQAA